MNKKTLLNGLFLLLCMIAGGVNSAWAEDYTIGWGSATGTEGSFSNFKDIKGEVNGILSFTAEKNGAGSNPAYYDSNDLRLYFGTNGNGCSITLSPAENITITNVVVTAQSNYAPRMGYSVDGNSAVNINATNNVYSISDISATKSIKLQNTNTTNTQLRIKTIKITYTRAATASSLESISLSGNYPTEFNEGDKFSHEGMIVTANYDNGTTKDVTDKASFSEPDMTSVATQEVTVSYAESGIEKSTTYSITVKKAPIHTVIFSVNGVESEPVNVKEGADINFPTPNAIDEKVFVGWVTETIAGTTDDVPELITQAVMGKSDIIYYAVFATKGGEEEEITDVLDNAFTGITGSTYTRWTKAGTSGITYVGQSAGGNNAIQLRSGTSNNSTEHSGIVTTTTIGKLKKVEVTWNTNTTNGRALDIYGSNEPYATPDDLYTYGKPCGSIAYRTSTDLETESVIEGDFSYIGLRSNNGAMFLDNIKITWVISGYSGYCTTVPTTETATVEISEACTDGKKCYATYSNSQAFIVPKDVTVAEIAVIDGELLIFEYKEGDIVPANTGVMISSETPGEKTLTLTTGGESVLGEDNLLRPTGNGITAAEMEEANQGCKFYRLTMHQKTQIGYWWGAAEGAAFDYQTANRAYLAVPKTVSAREGFTFGNETTGINAAQTSNAQGNSKEIYNLAGQRVAQPTKGLYIVNGKKVVIK